MTPEELITMGASPADADTSVEELIKRQERRRRSNLDCSIEGRGEFLTDTLGQLASNEVAPDTESKVE